MKDNASIFNIRNYGVWTEASWIEEYTIITMHDNASIWGNSGSGVYLNDNCKLLMYDDVSIDGNDDGLGWGGGLRNFGGYAALYDRARISNNYARYGGGVYLAEGSIGAVGTLDLFDFATINGNTTHYINYPYPLGMGVYIGANCLLRMYDNSSIFSNGFFHALGGGVYQEGGNFIMYGGIVYGDNYYGGAPIDLENFASHGSALYRDENLPASSSIYGDQTPILREGWHYADHTIEGRE